MKFFKWVKRFFTRDYSGTTEVYESHGNPGKEFKANWGIIIPHTKSTGGAGNDTHKMNEYYYGLKMVKTLGLPFETRDSGGVRGATKRLLSKGIKCTLEPHKNAYNGKAFGFEILVLKGDDLSIHYAELFAQAFKARFPDRRLRHGNGLKVLNKGDRGAGNLVASKKAGAEVALLSEAFFIDNDSEWIAPEEMAQFWSEQLV